MKDIKYIIVPDVHGRKFWRESVEKYIDSNIVFIFLGDYLDPYPNENTSNIYDNFLNIIEYKKLYPEKFVLLLGNHDIHYFGEVERCTRYNYIKADKYKQTFLDNIDLFQITYTAEVNDKTFLFSHAGILKDWIYNNHKIFNIGVPEYSVDYEINDISELPDFNGMFKDPVKREQLFASFDDISVFRGGNSQWPSIIWADVRDHLNKEQRIPEVIQIFGHTQQAKDPINYDNEIYCLDCRKNFAITIDGNIISLDDEKEIPALNSEEEINILSEQLLKSGLFFF